MSVRDAIKAADAALEQLRSDSPLEAALVEAGPDARAVALALMGLAQAIRETSRASAPDGVQPSALYDLPEVARRLGCSLDKARRMTWAKDLPVVRVGRLVKVRGADLLKAMGASR